MSIIDGLGDVDKQVYLSMKVDQLTSIYKSVQESLISKLGAIDLTQFQRYRTEALLKETRTILKGLNSSAAAWAKDTMPQAYTRGFDLSSEMLKNINVTRVTDFGAQIHTSAVDVLMDDTTIQLLNANQSIGRNIQMYIRRTQQVILQDLEISKMIAEGVIRGEPLRATKDRLLVAMRKNIGEGKLISINGRQYQPDKYATLIARTRTREATSQGSINTALQYDVDLMQISAHSDSCPYCLQFQGNVYSISGNTRGFPILDEYPPYHPNCFDKDTEVYTERGFIPVKDAKVGEKTLSLNPETFDLEWVPVVKLHAHKEEEMIHFKNRNTDILVTGNHNMFYQTDWDSKHNKDRFQFKKAGELVGKKSGRFYASSKWKGKDLCTEEFARFMGIWLSEGYVTIQEGRYVIGISQSKEKNPEKYSEMKDIITAFTDKHICETDVNFRFYDEPLGKYLEQFGKSGDKFVPEEVKNSSPEIIREFLNCFAMGDGSIKKGKKWRGGEFNDSITYFTSSERMAGDIGELIVKTGKRVTYNLVECGGKKHKFKNGTYTIKNNLWKINECSHRNISLQNMDIKKVKYNDMTYCVTLEKYHTLFIRRNGKTAWCGNCEHVMVPVTASFLRDRYGEDGYKHLQELSDKPHMDEATARKFEHKDTTKEEKKEIKERYKLIESFDEYKKFAATGKVAA